MEAEAQTAVAAVTALSGWLGRLARTAVRDYRLNWVLRSPDAPAALVLAAGVQVRRLTVADREAISRAADAKFRGSIAWTRAGAEGFVLVRDGRPCCVAHFVGPATYQDGAIWPLMPGELALIDIVTNSADRGRGAASLLIASATPAALADAGQPGPAICFIWWNHQASLRAFRRAGWRRIGFSVEVTGRRGRVWRRQVRLRQRVAANSLQRA